MVEPLILASASPRRKQLLEWAKVPFTVRVHQTDESYPEDLPVEQVPLHIARAKGLAVYGDLEDRKALLLAADTVVILGDRIIGKPGDRREAIRILEDLSGQEHRVITGVFLKRGDRELGFSDTTRVDFHPLTRDQIEFYVDEYRPYDKAGAYAIQEWIGVIGIRGIFGDFYNVMGLPVSRVLHALVGFFDPKATPTS